MPGLRNICGMRSGRLVALHRCGSDKQGRAVWMCQCDCGALKEVPSRHMVNSAVKSCGCLISEVSALNGKKGAHKLKGKLSHLYKTELTDEDRIAERNTPELRAWRKSVFERDNYTCDICGAKGGRLNAHHLNCWSDNPEQRYSVDNGITLCKKHHSDFHKYMGGPRNPCSIYDYMKFREIWNLKREIEKRKGGI